MDHKKLIDSDKYHEKYASKGGQIGIIQLWAFNNCYLFINFETGKKSQVSIKNISKLKILSKIEFNKLFVERNISMIKAQTYHLEYSTNKLWTDKFCREMAGFITNYNLFTLIVKKYGTIAEARKDPKFSKICLDYFGDINPNNMFYKKCKELGLCEYDLSGQSVLEIKITEKQIINYIKKAKLLPENFYKAIFDKGFNKSKEINHYIKLAV